MPATPKSIARGHNNGRGFAKFHGSIRLQIDPCRASCTAGILSLNGFNLAHARIFRRQPCFGARKKHCAAQAEYGRLAAQA
jgi:hypothetical protein